MGVLKSRINNRQPAVATAAASRVETVWDPIYFNREWNRDRDGDGGRGKTGDHGRDILHWWHSKWLSLHGAGMAGCAAPSKL